jgi:NADH-quinone oxidoreductase subunit J
MMLLNAILAPGALPPPAANTDRPSMAMPNPDRHGTVAELGRVMFGHYLWTVELAGTLLLVAGIGAIAIAQQEPEARA